MSRAPALLGEGRGGRFALLAGLAVGQAAAAAGVAAATRSLFVRWHAGADPLPAVAGLAAAAALLALLGLAARLLAEDLGQRYAAAVRHRVFAHLAQRPLASVEAMREGGLMLRFTGDLAALSGWVSRGAARLLSAAIALPLGLAALAWISPAGAAGAAGPLALGALATVAIGRGLGRDHRALRRRRARLAADMGERLRLAPLLRLIGRMRHERGRLDAASRALRRAAVARVQRRGLVATTVSLAGVAAAAGLIIGCHVTGAPAGEVAGALAALGLTVGHARALGSVRDRWQAAAAARGRLEALLAGPTLRSAGRAVPRPDRAALRFAGVTAGPVRAFTADLAAGHKAVLTGPAGSGKTTLLRLAAGLARPEGGRVRVFGADPQRLTTRDRARTILYLGPEPPVLAGSLRRALCLGLRGRPDDAALRATAVRIGLGRLLDRLGGLDAPLAEGGRNLSHGERALIGLARLALAPAALALIDGLDAHLDTEGRAALAAEITARPGAALCVLRHGTPHDPSLSPWVLTCEDRLDDPVRPERPTC